MDYVSSAACLRGSEAAEPSIISRLLRAGAIRPVFQPIEHLMTGEIAGFEALARLEIGEVLFEPAAFMPGLAEPDLMHLFLEMVRTAAEMLSSESFLCPGAYISINVEASVLQCDGFFDSLQEVLNCHEGCSRHLVLELLEGQEIADSEHMRECLRRARSLGLGIALDDIGKAYSSLSSLRDLPIDIIKLDQSFARGLREHPESLHIIRGLRGIARGLGKRMIVEGVESSDVHDALRVLGVEYAQGYGIARPMRPDVLATWIAGRHRVGLSRTPASMLGAYASHLLGVEACRVLAKQPLSMRWGETLSNPHGCEIGRYLDAAGLHETACGQAHKHLHEVLSRSASAPGQWEAAARAFGEQLILAIRHNKD